MHSEQLSNAFMLDENFRRLKCSILWVDMILTSLPKKQKFISAGWPGKVPLKGFLCLIERVFLVFLKI